MSNNITDIIIQWMVRWWVLLVFTVAPNRPDQGRRRENSPEARWQKISESNEMPTNLQLPSVTKLKTPCGHFLAFVVDELTFDLFFL